jgi:hypothetical protein
MSGNSSEGSLTALSDVSKTVLSMPNFLRTGVLERECLDEAKSCDICCDREAMTKEETARMTQGAALITIRRIGESSPFFDTLALPLSFRIVCAPCVVLPRIAFFGRLLVPAA